MPRPVEPGVRALRDYQPVRFFPFAVEPGQSISLTADPWSYLAGWLTSRTPARKGKLRSQFERATYYAQLARQFCRAAEVTDLPARGTLAYYSMLNLAKVVISLEGVQLETTKEHHGLSVPTGMHELVEIHPPAENAANIFHAFAASLGTPVSQKATADLPEIIGHIPELHEIAFAARVLGGGKRTFLPLEISLLVNAKTKDWLFTEVSFEKQQEARVRSQAFLRGDRKEYFLPAREERERLIFRSKARKKLSKGNWARLYSNILQDYGRFHIASILTRAGYRYYCDLSSPPFHHLCYSLMLLFYIGSIARYRPAEFEANMKSGLQPVITEAVMLCPRQFLYQVVSRVTRSACVVPFASI